MMMMRARMAGLALAVGIGTMMSMRPAGAQQTDVALVYRLLEEGRMVVTPPGAQAHPAQVGERLRNGAEVLTGPSTRAALRFTDDASILRLNPNARVRLTSGNEQGVVVRTLNLEFGELWVRVNRQARTHLRVQTPAGVAAVKGTQFVVRVDSQGVTTVLTLEGVVEFFNEGGRVDLPAGRKVTAASQTDVPQAQPASAQELHQAETVRGDEGGGAQGTWVAVQLRDANGQTRTLMLQVPADALRERLEGRP
ncbi:MAG TPA: FecR family protein [Longimicrobium sp.]|nr:FecR family protein [Longimicrobium sp.]